MIHLVPHTRRRRVHLLAEWNNANETIWGKQKRSLKRRPLTYIAENDAVFRRRDFDAGLDVAEVVRRQQHRLRFLDKLQVAWNGLFI